MLPCAGLREERVEGVVEGARRLVSGHLSIWLDTMFQTVEFPTGVTDLNSSLTHVNADTLPLEINTRGTLNFIPSPANGQEKNK